MNRKSKKFNKYKMLFEKNKRFRTVVIAVAVVVGVALFSAYLFSLLK